jgi:hypothetical protein
MNAPDIPFGVRTELNPQTQWSTWLRPLEPSAVRWAPRATVIHEETGRYQVRLPGIGSPSGIPHVTESTPYTYGGTCTVADYYQDGPDEVVTVTCFDGRTPVAGPPMNTAFIVYFGVPDSGDTPMATLRYEGGTADADPLTTPDTFNSTGGGVHVHRTGVGDYLATVDGAAFDGSGYVQLTPYGSAPARCQNAETTAAGDGGGFTVHVLCHATSGHGLLDTGWLLTYVQGASLSHDASVPAAYAQTTVTPPGPGPLAVDEARSFNSVAGTAHGTMTVWRNETGMYTVAFKGVGKPGAAAQGWTAYLGSNSVQVVTLGSKAGFCRNGNLLSDTTRAPGEIWVYVNCHNPSGGLADLPFGVAVLRTPGGPVGPVTVTQPTPRPGPKWGYVAMNAYDTAPGLETELTPVAQWSTWAGNLDWVAQRWVRRATVVHGARAGEYTVRLPGIGSATGLPHLTVNGWPRNSAVYPVKAVAACVVRGHRPDGIDELVSVACFDASGAPTNATFTVFFGEPGAGSGPSAGSTPMATMAYDGAGGTVSAAPLTGPGTFNSTGGEIRVDRLGPGDYLATADGTAFDASGYAQITSSGGGPVQCRDVDTVRTAAGMRIHVSCHALGTGLPTDSPWLLTYVQGTPLPHDATLAGAYTRITTGPAGAAVDPDHTYTTGGAISAERKETGWVHVVFQRSGRPGDSILYVSLSPQVVTLGTNPGHCVIRHGDATSPPGGVSIDVYCYDAAGNFADLPFGAALIRRP